MSDNIIESYNKGPFQVFRYADNTVMVMVFCDSEDIAAQEYKNSTANFDAILAQHEKSQEKAEKARSKRSGDKPDLSEPEGEKD